MNSSKFEAVATRYPELNFRSDKFNPLLALESNAVHITIPCWKAPIYYDIAEFEQTMKWKQMIRAQQQQPQTSKNYNHKCFQSSKNEWKSCELIPYLE